MKLKHRGVSIASAAIAAFALAGAAGATTISGKLNVDNAFDLYLSTDDSTLGTLLLSGNSWPTTYVLAPTALSGSTLFLHVVATDSGAPAAFLGEFTLGDAGYQFSNGTQALLTSVADWTVRTGSFAGANETPVSLGLNGVSPWGLRPDVSPSAQWIWDADGCGSCTRYFSTQITSAVPEPESYALMLVGLAGLAGFARRSRPD